MSGLVVADKTGQRTDAGTGADQDHRHRYIDAAPQQQRLEHVVYQSGDEHVDGKDDGPGARALGGEHKGNHRAHQKGLD